MTTFTPDPTAATNTLTTELARLRVELDNHRTAAEKARVAADERDRARLTAEQQARQERNDRAVEPERACEYAVLGQSEATAYADQLVGLARQMSSSAKAPFLAMASRADLSTRVGAVLDGS